MGWRHIARIPFGGQYYCGICGSRVQRFLPYRDGLASVPPLILHLEAVGSDVENFECPACQSHDRERHLVLYLTASDLFPRMRQARILHLAPEQHIQKLIRAEKPAEYVLGDLFPASTLIEKINLEAVPYPDGYFDFVLANHVLEHVRDDAQALREIFRVLRPDGHAILQTPFARGLTRTFEDPAIQAALACLHAYGQEDHCRLYGQDIERRFTASGLLSEMSTHAERLPKVDAARLGVNSAEPFFLFRKPKADE